MSSHSKLLSVTQLFAPSLSSSFTNVPIDPWSCMELFLSLSEYLFWISCVYIFSQFLLWLLFGTVSKGTVCPVKLEQVMLLWIPGQNGILDNEDADALARVGSRSPFPESSLNLCMLVVLRLRFGWRKGPLNISLRHQIWGRPSDKLSMDLLALDNAGW